MLALGLIAGYFIGMVSTLLYLIVKDSKKLEEIINDTK